VIEPRPATSQLRIRPILGLARWCAYALVLYVVAVVGLMAAVVGLMAGTVLAAVWHG
jgi:hypothetical protein